jgi:hypothetical protein
MPLSAPLILEEPRLSRCGSDPELTAIANLLERTGLSLRDGGCRTRYRQSSSTGSTQTQKVPAIGLLIGHDRLLAV